MIPRGVPYLAPAGQRLDELEKYAKGGNLAVMRAEALQKAGLLTPCQVVQNFPNPSTPPSLPIH